MLSTLLNPAVTLLKPAIVVNGKKYKVVSQIGEGAFGYVYRVRSTHADDRNECYALKKMICQTTEQLDEAKREIDVMLKIQHSNILPLLSFSYLKNKKAQDEVYLLMPLYHTSVQFIIDEGFGYPRCSFADGLDVVKILRHCAEGLQALHQSGFRHGDFKPANILVSESYHAVLTDFGSVVALERTVTNRSEALEVQDHASSHSTASYRAPELFDTPNQCLVDGKTDVWAFGCTMYALFYSRTPFETAAEGLSTLSVMAGQYHIPEDNIWPQDYLDLISACLAVDPMQRIDVTNLQLRLKRICSPPLDLHRLPTPQPPSTPPTQVASPFSVPAPQSNQNQQRQQSEEHKVTNNFADFSSAPEPINEAPEAANIVRDTCSIDGFSSCATIFREPSRQNSWSISTEEKLPSGTQLSTLGGNGSSSIGLDLHRSAYEDGSPRTARTEQSGDYVLTHHQQEDDEDEFGDFATNYVTKRPSVDTAGVLSPSSGLRVEVPMGQGHITPPKPKEQEEDYQAVDLLQAILAESVKSGQVLKEGSVSMMRMGGFSKKLMRKEVWLVVTTSGLILRKEAAPTAKLHEALSFHRPLSLTPSDTFAVGMNGLSIAGSSPQCLGSSMPSTPGTPQHMEGEAKSGEEDWVTIERKKIKSRFAPCTFEIAFADKDELSEWMDIIWQQYERCRE